MFVPEGPIYNTLTLLQVMAWCRTGNKPLSKAMLTQFTDAYVRHEASVYWSFTWFYNPLELSKAVFFSVSGWNDSLSNDDVICVYNTECWDDISIYIIMGLLVMTWNKFWYEMNHKNMYHI